MQTVPLTWEETFMQNNLLKMVDKERGVEACRACEMTLRRNRAAGKDLSKAENVYCMDCQKIVSAA